MTTSANITKIKDKDLYIAVTCTGVLEDFPPAISLVTNLIELGCRVSLLACGKGECLPNTVRKSPNFEWVSLGSRGGSPIERGGMLLNVPKTLRSFLAAKRDDLDFVWTTMAIDVRDIGKMLLKFNHIMQIPELTETVPAFLHTNRWPYSEETIRIARAANRVVVPEYNRAFIQQTWWHLPNTPAVLPNKPADLNSISIDEPNGDLIAKLKNDSRRMVLYQGLFADDRDLSPFADAIDMLGDNYVLYLMGKASDDCQRAKLNQLISGHNNIEYIGYFPAPNHLAYTPYAWIGLLPYTPSYDGACPPLNALYCAPNKIWEYSRFGVPMIGSDIPGLTSAFARYGCGETTRADAFSIANAIERVSAAHDAMSENARRFYDSIDTKEITASIICEALENCANSNSIVPLKYKGIYQ